MSLPENFNKLFAEVEARHKEASMILSMDDEIAKPNKRLLSVAMQACGTADGMTLPIFDGRPSQEPRWFDTWPGEHYRLLAALVKTLNPRSVIEVGTFTGMGTLSLLQELQPDSRLVTFDLLGWQTFERTWFEQADFASGRVRQVLHDISTPGGIDLYRALFESADLIFVDGPKDGYTEAAILANLETLNLSPSVVIMFDDIRVMNMLDVWRRIRRPKLDLTSFGHWSGTGLIDWNG